MTFWHTRLRRVSEAIQLLYSSGRTVRFDRPGDHAERSAHLAASEEAWPPVDRPDRPDALLLRRRRPERDSDQHQTMPTPSRRMFYLEQHASHPEASGDFRSYRSRQRGLSKPCPRLVLARRPNTWAWSHSRAHTSRDVLSLESSPSSCVRARCRANRPLDIEGVRACPTNTYPLPADWKTVLTGEGPIARSSVRCRVNGLEQASSHRPMSGTRRSAPRPAEGTTPRRARVGPLLSAARGAVLGRAPLQLRLRGLTRSVRCARHGDVGIWLGRCASRVPSVCPATELVRRRVVLQRRCHLRRGCRAHRVRK